MEAILRLAVSQSNIKVRGPSLFICPFSRPDFGWENVDSENMTEQRKRIPSQHFSSRLDNLFFPRPSCPIDGGGRYCLRLLNPEKNDIWGLNKSRSHLLPNPRSLGVTSVAWNLDQPTLSLVFILMIMMVLIMKWKSWLWPTHRKLPPDASYSPSQSPSVALSSSSALVEASSQSPSSSLTHHIHL